MFDPAINAAFQSIRYPALDVFFQLITGLGYTLFLLTAIGALYWGWDKRKTFMLIQLVGYCALVNHCIKEWVQALRPFQVAPDLVQLLDTHMRDAVVNGSWVWKVPYKTSYSFPSGHAQGAICFWGGLAYLIRRPAATVVAVVMIVLIPLSRIYLGVHFAGDVTTGLLIGGAILGLFILVVRCIRFDSRHPSNEMLAVLAFLGPILFFFLVPDRSTAMTVGLLLGFSAGYLLERRKVRFANDGTLRDRGLRVVLGVALMTGLAFGLFRLPGAIYGLPFPYPLVERLVGFFIVGIASTLAMPWLFVRAGLASQSSLSPG